MKKLKFITASAAIAALTLTACQNDVDFTQEDAQNAAAAAAALDDNAIQFGTYLNQNLATRAGYEGSIDNNKLKDLNAAGTAHEVSTNGFGVFAYYTGTKTYNQAQYYYNSAVVDAANQIAPNFMYNQQVYWDPTNYPVGPYLTSWTYSPLKYWPNEIETAGANHAVDDQDGNTSNDPAIAATHGADEYYGGNVSFFAYAPYVEVTTNTGVPTSGSTTDGITVLTTNADKGDPKVTYVVADDGQVVDLLWGTYYGTKENVVKEGNNLGVCGNDNAADDLSGNEYDDRILGTYRTNADLTKQKTTGYIGFMFKHALAKIGGSLDYSNPEFSPKFGFMAVLDLDDMKGAETGGYYTNNGLVGGTQTTKVTINEISIEAFSKINIAAAGDPEVWKYVKKNQGTFNLATGQWDILRTVSTPDDNLQDGNGYETPSTSDDAAKTTHNILPTTTDIGDTRNGTLNTSIAEAMEGAVHKDYDNQPTGVTTTPQNVYASEANPLVFIPGTCAELYVTCDYYVRTKDANLALGYSEVRQKIKKKITFTTPLELNKQYSLLMHIGLTGVKFTASVSEWDVNTTNKNFDVDNDGNPDIRVEDVYVPINVSELTAFTPTLTENADGTGASHDPATAFNSDGEAIYISQVALDYSDNKDDKYITLDKYAAENVTITVDGGATYNSGTGELTIPANTTESSKSYTITLKRGNISTGNYQTVTYTLTQKAPVFDNFVTLTLSPSAVSTTTAVTPTVNARYHHTGNTSNTFNINVTTGGIESPTYTSSTDGSSYSSATAPFTATVSGTPSVGEKLLYVKATYKETPSTAAEVTYTNP